MSYEQLIESAKPALAEAVKFDGAGDYTKAFEHYMAGIDLLMKALKSMPDGLPLTSRVREQLPAYVDRAEDLKKKFSKRVASVKKLQIRDDAIGYSYERIFEPCLDESISEVEVEDPWIQSVHQIHQLVHFCELLVTKCPQLTKVRLRTQRKEDGFDRQNEAFNELAGSLKTYGVAFEVTYATFHDREMRFSNGWVVKSGRGLDIYKAAGKFNLFASKLERRKCKETTIDMYRCVG